MSRYSPGKKNCVKFIVMVFFELLDFDYYIIVVFRCRCTPHCKRKSEDASADESQISRYFFSKVQCAAL